MSKGGKKSRPYVPYFIYFQSVYKGTKLQLLSPFFFKLIESEYLTGLVAIFLNSNIAFHKYDKAKPWTIINVFKNPCKKKKQFRNQSSRRDPMKYGRMGAATMETLEPCA